MRPPERRARDWRGPRATTAGALLWLSCAAQQLLASAYEMQLGKDAWASRDQMNAYNLGPAPYPAEQFMDWELFGSCFARPDAIHVTDAVQDQKGGMWARKALERADNWQADVVFRVGGQPGELFGDGFGFWLVSERGLGGDALGGPHKWNGLAIFFDTYKNKEFKGKRHPYVYGIVNNGDKDYLQIKSRDVPFGCHIPFRDANTEDLATTEARITYREKAISVIMRPRGAVDWVQCFQMEDVTLPGGGFFGITAMTGQLVDKHHISEIKVFTNVELNPWEYAAPNDLSQMPDMWEAMRHSGDVAREFESWEQEILDETRFDPRGEEDAYAYEDEEYYGDAPYDEDYQDPYDDADDGYGKKRKAMDLAKGERLRERRRKHEERREARRKERGEAPDNAEKVDLAELESISELLAGTEEGKRLHKMQQEQRSKLNSLRDHLEADISEASERLTGLVRDIRVREHEMNKRIAALAQKLHVSITPLREQSATEGRSWLWPFLILLAAIVALASFGYTRYRSFMKTHLL